MKFLKIFPVRWAASTLSAVERIINRLETLLGHLQQVIGNRKKEFSPQQVAKATAVYRELTDENLLILLNFQRDVLLNVASQSLIYQKSGASVIGEHNRQRIFSEKLDQLRHKNSETLTKFLQEAKCAPSGKALTRHLKSKGKTNLPSCGTVEKYERSNFKAYKGHRISVKMNQYESLSTYLDSYVDRLVKNHEKYMFKNEELMEQFDSLDQRLWKETDPSDGDPIIALGSHFSIDNPQELGPLWIELKTKLMQSSFFCTNVLDKPRDFWSRVLQMKDIAIHPKLRRLIQVIQVLATNSADAER